MRKRVFNSNQKKPILIVGMVLGVIISIGILSIVIALIVDDINGINYFDEISYETPEKFDVEDYDSFRSMSYSDNRLYCYIELESYEKEYYKDAKNVIEKNVQFGLNDDVSDLEEFNENGKKGYKLTVKTMEELSLQNKSYYSIESTNYIYLIKYSTYDYKKGDREDINTHICYTAKDDFIKSIKVK